MARHQREYGLTSDDREFEIQRKFGAHNVEEVRKQLDRVINRADKILGAIVFLGRESHPEDIAALVLLANTNPSALLGAATVKEERG